MHCKEIETLLVLRRGTLDANSLFAVKNHIECCSSCQMEARFEKLLAEVMVENRDVPQLDKGFNQRVLTLAAEIQAQKKPAVRNNTALIPLMLSCLGVAFSLLVLYSGFSDQPNIYSQIVDFFFSFKPFIAAGLLLLTFLIIYVNEQFFENTVLTSRPSLNRRNRRNF